MKVKCLKNVYGNRELLFRENETYPTHVYKGVLSAQTLHRKSYPLGYEAIAYNHNEDWNKDEWFRHYFEIEN